MLGSAYLLVENRVTCAKLHHARALKTAVVAVATAGAHTQSSIYKAFNLRLVPSALPAQFK